MPVTVRARHGRHALTRGGSRFQGIARVLRLVGAIATDELAKELKGCIPAGSGLFLDVLQKKSGKTDENSEVMEAAKDRERHDETDASVRDRDGGEVGEGDENFHEPSDSAKSWLNQCGVMYLL
jgi:predicted  nucleic acid-binding Zn-ribbon protein